MLTVDIARLKTLAAEAAVQYVTPRLAADSILGIGTGSTTNQFISLVPELLDQMPAVVSSSDASTDQLQELGIQVTDTSRVHSISLYVDGADEIDPNNALIKGGGGALTKEKILAAMAEEFVCIVDETKVVERLGQFPLPIEVIKDAVSLVSRELARMGGSPEVRQDFLTDSGNVILDIHGLSISDPTDLEQRINEIPGVVTNGIFARHRPNRVFIGTSNGIVTR